MSDTRLIETPISNAELKAIALERFGDMVKAVVDIERGLMAVGGELHADEEAFLLERGSQQAHLWGINLYPEMRLPDMVEFDSMINVRPSQGNRSRTIEDAGLQQKILAVVSKLII